MYQCLICLDAIELPGFCWCGRTELDHKLRVSGEIFIQIAVPADQAECQTQEKEAMQGKSRIEKCPHCGWKGLVVPRLSLGCPEHGIWWYKSAGQSLHMEERNEEESTQSGNNSRRAEKSKYNKKWKSLRLRG